MTMTTFMPFDVDTFLEEALRAGNGTTSWSPACNAYEDERCYWVQAALPGLERKDIEIVVEDEVLTIKAERKEDNLKTEPTSFVSSNVAHSSDRSSCRTPRIRPK
jgi:HSP20 family molecular chaperone IbpA